MRVVLDTNVLVAALGHPLGPCGRLLDLVLDGVVDVCVDGRLVHECAEVLRRPKFRLSAADVDIALDFFRQNAIPTVAPPLSAALPDADDLPFLEVAAAASAMLVTGNRRHFPKDAVGSITVVSPAECLELLRKLL